MSGCYNTWGKGSRYICDNSWRSGGLIDILRYNEESKDVMGTNSKRIQYDEHVGVYNLVEQLRDTNVIGAK